MLFRLFGARRPAEADRAAELGKAGTDEKGADAGIFWVKIYTTIKSHDIMEIARKVR